MFIFRFRFCKSQDLKCDRSVGTAAAVAAEGMIAQAKQRTRQRPAKMAEKELCLFFGRNTQMYSLFFFLRKLTYVGSSLFRTFARI